MSGDPQRPDPLPGANVPEIPGQDTPEPTGKPREESPAEALGFEPELLEQLPPQLRSNINALSILMQRTGPMPNPLQQKITEGHIDKVLDLHAKADERAFQDAQRSRCFNVVYFFGFVALFVFATIYISRVDKELYKEFLKLTAVFLGGLGSGFGIKSYMDKK